MLASGGTGFIGSHVAGRLVSEGHEVAVVDNLSNGRLENVPAEARFYEADIRDDCADAFRDFRPEALCHHAAQVSVRHSVENPCLHADINLVGTVRLLQGCVEYGVRKVVFASTGGAIYGEQESFPAREEHPQRPVSPYGLSKLAAERYLDYYCAHHHLLGVVLRYANVYGPRQDPHGEAGVVAIFCKDLTLGNTSTINGTGEQTRDYVYVEDVVHANVLALANDTPSGIYNVGTGIETSVNELHRLLRETSGKSLPARHGTAKVGEQARSSVDPTRLGWRPRTGLIDSLHKTLHYLGMV